MTRGFVKMKDTPSFYLLSYISKIMNIAILLAGGSGSRLGGGLPKQFSIWDSRKAAGFQPAARFSGVRPFI